MVRIAIIGSGFVGDLTGRGFESLGHEILWYDLDYEKISSLKRTRNSHGFERASTDIMDIVPYSDVCFLCVPTETLDYEQDLSCVIGATRAVGRGLRERQEPYLFVNRSTVLPGVTRETIIPTLEKTSGKKVGRDILVCHNPEFSTEIHRSWTRKKEFRRDFPNSRVIIGGFDEKSGQMLEELYRSFDVETFHLPLEGAELLKYASNIALASRISLWNQMYIITKKLGIDGDEIAKIVGMDPRIGEYGTVCGMAYGGSCLPKDTRALIGYCQKKGIKQAELLSSVDSINRYMAENYGIRE